MVVILMADEDSRPRQYWFKNKETGESTKSFFMGEVDEQKKILKSLGIKVIKE